MTAGPHPKPNQLTDGLTQDDQTIQQIILTTDRHTYKTDRQTDTDNQTGEQTDRQTQTDIS